MPDPYAPRSSQTASEMQSPLDYVCERLRRLGGTADEIEAVREAWEDPEWPADERAALVHVGDTELVQELLASRRDHEFHSLTPDEQVAVDEQRVFQIEVGEVEERAYKATEGIVDELLAWVRDESEPATKAARAGAALRWERRGRARKSALEPLEALIRANGPDDALAWISGDATPVAEEV